MPNEVDRSLLDRLQALRGSSATPERPAATKIDVDVIERRKSPTGDDKLRDRLKNLRDGCSASPGTTEYLGEKDARKPEPQGETNPADPLAQKLKQLRDANSRGHASPGTSRGEQHPKRVDLDLDIDTTFLHTSDNDLEELLRDVPAEESFTAHSEEPGDAQIRKLLEQLSDSVPRGDQRDDDQSPPKVDNDDDDDDSDGDNMEKQVDNVIARFRDELEMEKNLDRSPSPEPPEDDEEEQGQKSDPAPYLSLPDVPSEPQAPSANATSNAASTIDDLTARLSALQAPSDGLSLPSVPSNKPTQVPKRLESRTKYTDDDVDSWCTVCLEDATLLCMGCDEKGEPYCVRCWREMHVGPAAAFDDRSHKAVQFGKRNAKEKKVALGA